MKPSPVIVTVAVCVSLLMDSTCAPRITGTICNGNVALEPSTRILPVLAVRGTATDTAVPSGDTWVGRIATKPLLSTAGNKIQVSDERFTPVIVTMSPGLAEAIAGLDAVPLDAVPLMSVNPAVGENEVHGIFAEFWPVKPEPGSVADQLLTKGRQEGRLEGDIQGEIKLIRTLESILGIGPEAMDLSNKSLEELQKITDSLQDRIQRRG